MAASQLEPWLRETHLDLPVVQRAVLHALEQAGEDVKRWCGEMSLEELERRPFELPSAGLQMRHIARSLDRLMTYAEGRSLSEEQLKALYDEGEKAMSKEALFAEFDIALERAKACLLRVGDLSAPRGVGRVEIPTTAGSLLVHIAEHTMRHVGQAITTAKVVLAQR